MTNRVRSVVVTLTKPLLLSGLDEAVPAGRYEVTTEEEPAGDVMYPAYKRISATLYLPQVGHLPYWEATAEFERATIEFIDRVEGR